MNASISITDNATPALAAKIAQCDPQRLAAEIAPGLGAFWRNVLKQLPPNKNFPDASTGFWEKQAASVLSQRRDAAVQLTAGTGEGGIRQRLLGGPIKFSSKAGTIPIAEEAYGRLASEFGDKLVRVRVADGRWFLALWAGPGKKPDVIIFKNRAGHPSNESTRKAGDAKSMAEKLQFLYRLIPKGGSTAPQAPNPAVMPTDDEFTEVGLAELERRLNTEH